MKRFLAILLVFAFVAVSGCSAPDRKPVTEKDIQQKISENQSKLKTTEERLNKLFSERDKFKTKFLQIIYGKGKTPKEITEEFKKGSSELDSVLWYRDAKNAWQNWEMNERYIIVFTEQKERLEKELQELEQAIYELKFNEENKKAFSSDDPNLDAIKAGPKIILDEDKLWNSLSDAEKAIITNQANESMMTADGSTSASHFKNENNADSKSGSYSQNKAGERIVKTIKGVEFAFRWCPPGSFMMGSPKKEKGRFDIEIQHNVTISQGFWMMETEVTQKQWKAVMGNNPSHFKDDDLPVETVSWNDCKEFCRKTGLKLPTEAQWEYACRAGSTEAYAGNLNDMSWHHSNSGNKTHNIKMMKPNAWGLYDMHGNVMEWCADGFGAYPRENVTDPTGALNNSQRVFRGGSWFHEADFCRSAYRGDYNPEIRRDFLGVRLILGQ